MLRSLKHTKKQEGKAKPLRIRTGDEVLVVSGEGRSSTPRKVLAVLPREGKVVVEGVNIMKDREKNKGGSGRQAGINQQNFIEKPCPIAASNVMLIDPQSKKRTRIKMKTQPDGTRVRAALKSGETV
ncbi:MAG TPA: 50S ribosomal protein L24 [Abditibacteriaceae bacterium]|nr:50S ribosomal protein L24 [Abditibacteriaceae bacterium]